jgi:hypothetical protein
MTHEMVYLRGGLTVPRNALQCAIDVEHACWSSPDHRPHTPLLTVEGESLYIHPTSALTADQRASVKRWKRHLIALVHYTAPQEFAHADATR